MLHSTAPMHQRKFRIGALWSSPLGPVPGPNSRGNYRMGSVRDSLSDSKSAVADVFRNRNLRRLNLAFAGSVIGDWAYAVAAAVYAYTRGGATAVGILAVARYVSMAALSPFTSMLADRFDRRLVMVSADVIRVVLVLVAALVIQLDGPSFIVYLLAVVTALVGTAFRPAQGALLPFLANSPGELTAANVASSTIESVGFFAGPAIGGVLLAVTGVAAVYLFNAVSFAWSALLVWGLKPATPILPTTDATALSVEGPEGHDGSDTADEPTGLGRLFAGVGDGYREIFKNRDIRLLVGLYCAQTVVAGASAVAIVAIALDLLKLGNGGLGTLNATMGIGGLIGGLLALVLAQRGRLAQDFGWGVVLWAAPFLLIAAWPSLAGAVIAMVLIGVGNSVVDVNAFTILQRLVPDEVMGRVFGAMESAIVGGMALGALVMPILIKTVGLRTGLTVIGSAVCLIVVVAVRSLNRIDRVALAPEGLNLIRGVQILALLPEETLERLARRSRVVSMPNGQAVCVEGDPGDLFYMIQSGTVDVTIRGERVRSLGPGEVFGEIALLRDVPRTATVTATSDLVTRVLDRAVFLPAVTGHKDAAGEAEAVISRMLSTR